MQPDMQGIPDRSKEATEGGRFPEINDAWREIDDPTAVSVSLPHGLYQAVAGHGINDNHVWSLIRSVSPMYRHSPEGHWTSR
jgi:hypothetical protein